MPFFAGKFWNEQEFDAGRRLPDWTEGEAALEEKMETIRRDKPVRQPSKERLDYDQSRDEPADENRLNKSGSIC